MNFVTRAKQFTRVTTSGVACLTSAPCVLEGIFVPAVLTGQIVSLFHGNAVGTQVVGTCTLAANNFFELPVSLPNGLTYCVTNEDVDLTIFWSPANG